MCMKNKNGFTMIELIVVIALMGILATVGFSAYTASMQTGRDNRRKLDLKNVASALQLYYSDYSNYPAQPTYGNLPSVLSSAASPYMKILPVDPKWPGSTSNYQYMSYGGSDPLKPQCYCLSAKLERTTNYKDETNGACSAAPSHANVAPNPPSYYLLFCP